MWPTRNRGVQTDPEPPAIKRRRRAYERIDVPYFINYLSYFPMDKLMVGYPQLALDIFMKLDRKSLGLCRAVSQGWRVYIENERHWWKLQLFECKKLHLYENSHYFASMLGKMFPEIIEVIEEHICTNETFDNLKLFAQFMMEYFSQVKKHFNEYWIPKLDSPLHYASQQNRLDIFQILAKNASSTKLDLNFRGIYDNDELMHDTVLGEACANNRVEIIKFYMNLTGNQKVDFNKLSDHRSLFHQACSSGHVEVVKLFLDRANELNIDLNARELYERRTPFMFAMSKEVLGLLLNDSRIDVNATDDNQLTALLSLYDCEEPSDKYGQEHILELVSYMLESPRIDVTVGRTSLLHLASDAEEVEVVFKAALKRNIDVNRRDHHGKTPSHIAFGNLSENPTFYPPFTIKKFSPLIEVFLRYAKDLGIDFGATDNNGRTPMHYLYHAKPAELVAQFLEAAKREHDIEFDLEWKDLDGKVPLQYSMRHCT